MWSPLKAAGQRKSPDFFSAGSRLGQSGRVPSLRSEGDLVLNTANTYLLLMRPQATKALFLGLYTLRFEVGAEFLFPRATGKAVLSITCRPLRSLL